MAHTNPFMQDQWTSDNPPSILGVLPLSPALTSTVLTTFQISAFNPDILNSTVFAPYSRPILRVVTDSDTPGYTIWKDNNDRNIALVKWQDHPEVEMRNVVPRQRVGNWLALSPNAM
jgi:hypothetical protein